MLSSVCVSYLYYRLLFLLCFLFRFALNIRVSYDWIVGYGKQSGLAIKRGEIQVT